MRQECHCCCFHHSSGNEEQQRSLFFTFQYNLFIQGYISEGLNLKCGSWKAPSGNQEES